MSYDLTTEQMRKIAEQMSDMGRKGDSQLIHVMPEEVEFLERLGGGGTVNPQTGLKEFNSAQDKINEIMGSDDYDGWTSELNDLVTERDAGNASSSNKSSGNSPANDNSNSVRQTIANTFTPNDGKYYDGGILYNDGGSLVNQNTSAQNTANAATPFDGREYRNGQLVDGSTGQAITGNHDSVFKTALNVAAFAASPVAYFAKEAIGSVMDGGFKTAFKGDGSQNKTTAYIHPTDNDDNRSNRSTASAATTDENVTGDVSDDDLGSSELSGEFGYSNVSNFSTRLNGTSFTNYDYTDGTGRPVGTYNGNEKPFHIATSTENAKAYAMTEQGSNMIEQLISQLPRDVMDKLQGNVSMFTTSDNKVALVAGNEEGGFVEATYAADEDGYTSAMNDVGAMMEYARVDGDTDINAGFMGRVSSYQQYKGYATPGLQIELEKLLLETQNYEVGTPQHNSATRAMASIERELSRRTRSGSEGTAQYSIAGVTEQITQTADGMFS